MKNQLKCVIIGAGYFSHYHCDAWQRIPEATITAISDLDPSKAEARRAEFHIPRCYTDYRQMIDQEQPDFVDIITPPPTHMEIATYAAQQGIDVICQKPLAPTYAESEQIVETMQSAGVRFMVHENFRWQPWYREIKRLIEEDMLGEITSLYFRFRTGDGWGEDAYLSRQPFFRKYPRFFVYEAGVHFIDTFRYLLGEIESVYARLRRLNPVIQGEDCVHITFGFESGATAIFDGNRYNESEAVNTRFTFGEMRLDGSKGHLTLDTTGALHIKPLGQPTYEHSYPHPDQGFAGDCCYFLQRHFVESVLGDQPFDQEAADYLKTIAIVEQIYEQAKWQR